MKCTTSWASAASTPPSANGSRSAGARRTSTPGTARRAAATNDADGSTAATAPAPSRSDQPCGQRARPAADVQRPLPGTARRPTRTNRSASGSDSAP